MSSLYLIAACLQAAGAGMNLAMLVQKPSLLNGAGVCVLATLAIHSLVRSLREDASQ